MKQTNDNLDIQIDALTQSLVGVGQPWEIRLVVKNFGSETASNVKLILSVDGTPTSAKSLDVPSRAESQVTFGMIFPEAGSHRVEATLERNDSLMADNNATWSVLVMGTIPVLVVDSTLYDRKRTPESEFLQAALDPFADNPENHASLFRVSKITPDELKPDKLTGYKIIALANVAKLNDSVVEPLMQHIHAGGILLIFSGNRIDLEWYNENLATMFTKSTSEITSETKERFLPMVFDREPTILNREATGMKLRRENFQHPAVQFLNDTRTGMLDNIEIQGWYRLLPNGDTDQDSVARLVSLVNGDLLIAERAVGEGTVIQCATTCNDSWTNWPLRPVYLPMLHQLLLKSTPPSRWPMNVATNQQLNFPTLQVLHWIADTSSESSVARIRNPGTDESKIAASDDDSKSPVWHFPNAVESMATSIVASYPGIYRIDNLAESPLYLSAQAPLEESDLEAESEEGLKSLAERLGAQVIRSPDELISLDRRGSKELWRWFLIVLLVLLFGELFLQRRFSGAAV